MQKIVNVAEIADQEWDFIEKFYPPNDIEWHYYSASSQNFVERSIKRPKIGRYRACIQATRQIKSPQDIVISHMPRTSHWQSKFMNMFNVNARHLAFSFNFTELPNKKTTAAMKNSFERIDKFVVYSEYEKKLYSEYFDIPFNKFEMLHWAMEKPSYDARFSIMDDEYFCAIGGEGRDYKTLLAAFSKLNDKKLVIVTRPHAMTGLEIPSNVIVLYNIPASECWAIAKKSKAVVIPLRDKYTPCGHITLVGAMQLGKAIISSVSKGTEDYLIHNENSLLVENNNSSDLAEAINILDGNDEIRNRIEQNASVFANDKFTLDCWVDFVKSFVEKD